MIYKLLFIVAIFSCFAGQAQILNVKKTPHHWIVGIHSSGSGYNAVDSSMNGNLKMWNVYIEPYIAYFINENIGVGIIGGWSFVRSNHIPDEDLYELGVFSRYFYPLRFTNKSLKTIQFLSEVSYRRSTYQLYNSSDYYKSHNLDYNIFTIVPLGITIGLFKGLQFELSSEWIIFSADYAPLRYRIGFEYQFLQKQQ